jgi:predicted nucleic acid-binding protein
VTVLDTSAAVDFLLGEAAAPDVARLLQDEGTLAAPDLLVFETLAVIRRAVARGGLSAERGAGAIEDLGDLRLELFSTLPLRQRAWELRENMTAGDALFVALAEALDEPLATKDAGLAASAREHARIEAVRLPRGSG